MPDDIPTPPYRYVPGKDIRHPEDWFDAIKASVVTGEMVEQSQAWRAGLHYLDTGYYWECHEVLEAVWMSLPNPSPERDVTQALIQLANARLKLVMGKPRATLRLCVMVLDLLDERDGTILGLDVDHLRARCLRTRERAEIQKLRH